MKTIITNENFAAGQTFANRCFQSGKKLMSRIERAKNQILNEFRATRKSQANLFKQAVSEAEALAWQTGYPHLLFPALAMEKIQTVAAWQTRQQSLNRHRSVFTEA